MFQVCEGRGELELRVGEIREDSSYQKIIIITQCVDVRFRLYLLFLQEQLKIIVAQAGND